MYYHAYVKYKMLGWDTYFNSQWRQEYEISKQLGIAYEEDLPKRRVVVI